ncbi:MAG: hypothetical protein Fur0046_37180 [Cyanobacteria bacterium J069]|nr:MAG: hypothetical protein D6742_04265 [Cyanobacteria bacterium J069]
MVSTASASIRDNTLGTEIRVGAGIQPSLFHSATVLDRFRPALAGRASSTRNFGTLGSGSSRSSAGNVGKKSPDFFKFKITRQRTVSLDVTIQELISRRYIRGAILDSKKRAIKVSDTLRAPLESDRFSIKLKAGTYYTKIVTDGNRINYSFRLRVR